MDDKDNQMTELTRIEVELCKQNFQFYDKNRQGYVERFELPMILNGMILTYMAQVNVFKAIISYLLHISLHIYFLGFPLHDNTL